MIIIRANETQALPRTTGQPQVQYFGEGQEFTKAGAQIASTANQATQYSAALQAQYAKLNGINGGKTFHSTLQEDASKFLDQWNREYVEQGAEPTFAIKALERWFDDYQSNQQYVQAQASDNDYLKTAVEAAYRDVRADVITKAMAHARTRYTEIGRLRVDTVLDEGMRLALEYDAKGDRDGMMNQVEGDIFYLRALRGTYFNDDEITRKEKEYKDALEAKRAYAAVTRNPQAFLDAYEKGEFSRLDPKMGRELSVAAEQALSRKLELKDRERRLEKESLDEYRTTLKNEIIQQTLTDPAAALARMGTLETRLALGKEYDNTLATVRTMTNPATRQDDEQSVRYFNRVIELSPNKGTYADLDTAFRQGLLRESTFSEMTHRLSERIEKFQDKAVQERLRLTKQAIDVFKPMLRVTGINDFDGTSSDAQQNFEDELITYLNAHPEANPHVEGRRLMIKYRDYVMDRYLDVTEAIVQAKGYKSPADVLAAYERGEISRTESDKMLWYFQNAAKQSAAPQSSPSNAMKKK